MRSLLFIFTAILIGCADNKRIDGKEYKTFGLINKDEIKDPHVKYSLSWGNVIWGCVLSETVIAPVYFFGFSLWEPDSLAKENQ